MRQAWHVIEPSTKYLHNWHIDAICEHLEAVSRGEITRLVINVPFRTAKSSVTSVLWPAWVWITDPGHKFLCGSYALRLSIRDNLKMRRLITSRWFQERWGDKFRLTSDQNQKVRFENDQSGYRIAFGFESGVMGDGADTVCFPADETVLTEDGQRSIGDLVAAGSPIRVWSANTKTGIISLKAVTGFHRNPASRLVLVGLTDGTAFRCTPDHKIWTARGWVAACLLTSIDVLPGIPVLRHGYGLRGNTIHSAQRPVGQAGRADLADNVFCQTAISVHDAAPPIVEKSLTIGNRGPATAIADALHGASGDAVFVRNFGSRSGIGSDADCLTPGQDRAGPHFQNRESPVALGVSDVLGTSAVQEIAQTGIASVPVEMPHFTSWRDGSDECQCHSLVNEDGLVLTPLAGIEPWIPLMEPKAQEFFPYPVRVSLAHDGPLFTSDPSEVGDAVKWMTEDRSPLFVIDAGHADETFCLTVSDNHTFFVGSGNTLVSNCLDDPHDRNQAHSDAERLTALTTFDEAIVTRLNQPAASSIVIIMQRLHTQDLSGHVLERGGWDHLCIPMSFEPDHSFLSVTSLGWSDPRTEEGELMWPERFPARTIADLTRDMGAYAVAGQLQQRPAPVGGGILQEDWWQDWTKDVYPECIFTLAVVDTAYGANEKADHSACTVMGIYEDPATLRYRILLRHAWRKNLQFNDLVEKIEDTIRKQEVDKLIVEAKASGVSVVQELRRRLLGKRISIEARQPPPGDKIGRAYAVQGILQSGMVSVPLSRSWGDMVVTECGNFPNGRYRDIVDTVTMGLSYLRTRGLELYPEDDRPISRATQREAFY